MLADCMYLQVRQKVLDWPPVSFRCLQCSMVLEPGKAYRANSRGPRNHVYRHRVWRRRVEQRRTRRRRRRGTRQKSRVWLAAIGRGEWTGPGALGQEEGSAIRRKAQHSRWVGTVPLATLVSTGRCISGLRTSVRRVLSGRHGEKVVVSHLRNRGET
jgi:hypothetical protein